MNKENAHEYLPLVQALADGKTLQYKHSSKGWTDCNELYFDVMLECYRIKPEPRTFDVWINKKTKKEIVVEDGDSDIDEIFFEWERITVMEALE
jgi:hypothetical protein